MLATAAVTAIALLAPTEVIEVGGVNMEPALRMRQHAEFDLGAYAARTPRVGDVVLIHPPRGAMANRCGSPRKPRVDQLCVKPFGGPDERSRFITRVVAVGGDRIRFERGRVVRNGRVEHRDVRACTDPDLACTFKRAITVPKGHVYVAGDNRPSSDDSRFWGAVPVKQVLGRYIRTVR